MQISRLYLVSHLVVESHVQITSAVL